MNRLIRSALGVSATLALSVGGVTTASASTTKPEVGKWVSVNETFTFPAGSACKAPVTVKEHAKFRETVYRNQDKKVVKVAEEFKDWSHVKFSATVKGHKKSIKLNEGGDAVVYNVEGDFKTVLVLAEGTNWNQGNGVYGIPWTKGNVSFGVINADGDKAKVTNVDYSQVTKYIQVCTKVGSKPVWGKNYAPPEHKSDSKALASRR
jgi:hypothetical protein